MHRMLRCAMGRAIIPFTRNSPKPIKPERHADHPAFLQAVQSPEPVQPK